MTNFYLFIKTTSLLFLLCGANALIAQVSMGFENLMTTQTCGSTTCNYTDPTSAASAHVLMDAGGIPVSSPSSGTTLGFTSSFEPTRTGGSTTGLNDGDFFGYAGSTTISNNLGQNAFQGSQAFIAEDTDGEVTITFDPVNLTGAVAPMFTMNYILDGGFEFSDGANDLFYIGLNITGCPSATTIDLLDANGTGAGGSTNMNSITDQTWFPLSQDLSAHIGCQVELVVNVDLNASTEEVAIDNIAFSSGALPVELIDFIAKPIEESIRLNWSTASELNNDKFEIQESQDGRAFQKIGEIKGNGTDSKRQDYSFKVENPKNGISYYRLKQIDYDGKFEYSKTVSVRFATDQNDVEEFYPNPSKSGIVHLNYTAQKNDEIQISVFDLSGKLALSQIKAVTRGSNNLSFDFSELNQGIYMVTIETERKLVNRRLIIGE
ncbi:MAG: T9SS type A sorting domain-containing protein [Saprospiraceae bacterium]